MHEREKIEREDNSALRTPHSALLRSAAWMAWSGAVSIANGVVVWMAYARWRETAELGKFTIVMGLYTIFVTVCTLGLGPYIASEVARRKEQNSGFTSEFISSAAVFLSAWSLVSAAAMSLTGLLVSDSREVRAAVAILSLAMLPTGLLGVAEPVCTALGRARLIALATTVENVLRTVVPLALLYLDCNLSVICISFVGVRIVACLIYAGAARRQLAGLVRARGSLIRSIAARAPAFAGITVLASLHLQAAAVFIGRLGGETDTAQFGAASRLLIPVAVLMAGYVSVVQPAASRLADVSLPGLGEFLSRSLRLVMALVLPCAVGMALLARDLLAVLFGGRLVAAAPALSLLALSIVPFGAVMIVSRGLIATGNQRIDLAGNAAAVAVNLGLNLLLIPRYGATGAAGAQLVSMMTLLVIEAAYSARRLYRLEFGTAVIACAVPLGLMALVVWQARALGFWSAATSGAVVYLGCAMLVRRDLRLAFSRQ
ncbi:MAG TPA: polysaccharide biosynthesis C-terminal domain-containing protein [Blastocatellia bacterium]|nr:polysaccharide biosynthesis C-terminal domain-containing protein [Blastocatellia bacterium]